MKSSKSIIFDCYSFSNVFLSFLVCQNIVLVLNYSAHVLRASHTAFYSYWYFEIVLFSSYLAPVTKEQLRYDSIYIGPIYKGICTSSHPQEIEAVNDPNSS